MIAWIHRMGDEEGVSLVEMLITILLLGLVLAALGSTLFGSMAAARQNEGMTQATAIANEQLETLQASSWGSLVAPSTTPLPAVSRGGRTYQVTKTVSWIDNPRLKGYSIRLNWNEDGRPHTIKVDGRRARRSGESSVAPPSNPFRVTVFTINPDPVVLDSTGRSLAATNPALPGGAAMMFEVETSDPARTGSVTVTWPIPSPTSTQVLTEVAGSNKKKWTGLVASGATYPAGWMTFRVTAAKDTTATNCTPSPLPVSPNCAESTSAAYLMAPIANGALYHDSNDYRLYSGTPGTTGDRLCINTSTTRLRNSNPFYLGLKGLGADDTVILRRTDVAGVEFPMTWTKIATNWWWVADATSTGSGTFTLGTNSTWEIRWIRSYDNLTSTIPLTFATIPGNGNSPC